MQRVIGDDSTPQMVKINEKVTEGGVSKVKNNLSVGRYDVVMDTGPGYETKREEGADALIDLLKIGPLAEIVAKMGADLVFRAIDHPYMQELADRLAAQNPEQLKKIIEQLPKRAQHIVQSMGQENQQLQKQLEQLQTELKQGIAKEHIVAAAKIHGDEIRAHTSLAVEEIKAGASLMNTHVEAEHHRREAERMIEASQQVETPTQGA